MPSPLTVKRKLASAASGSLFCITTFAVIGPEELGSKVISKVVEDKAAIGVVGKLVSVKSPLPPII